MYRYNMEIQECAEYALIANINYFSIFLFSLQFSAPFFPRYYPPAHCNFFILTLAQMKPLGLFSFSSLLLIFISSHLQLSCMHLLCIHAHQV